ncbi:MAG: glucose-6-phosphate isomerase, partial [Acidobacteriota bacterium]
IDISRMDFSDDFFTHMAAKAERAVRKMKELEHGAIANPDEKRMVGHYWLRNAGMAPDAEIKSEITETLNAVLKFAADIHSSASP